MNIENSNLIKLEKRPYTADSTSPDEIAAIKNHVQIYDDQTIYYKEIYIMNEFTVNLMFDEAIRLGKTLGEHGLLIDLLTCTFPDSITRRVINKQFRIATESVSHVSFFTGKNVLLNAAARFVMYQSNLDSFSIHNTFESALQTIKDKING